MRYLNFVLRFITAAAIGGILLGAGSFASTERLPMAPTEPDRWHNYVCSAKESGATPKQTAQWLVRQHGIEVRASVQYTHKHWKLCEK